MRLIDADKVKDAICKACSIEGDFSKCDGYADDSDWCDYIVAIRCLPTVDPVKRGRWVDDYNETEHPLFRKAWKCSACGFRTSYGKPKYCMNCGAQMDGEEE